MVTNFTSLRQSPLQLVVNYWCCRANAFADKIVYQEIMHNAPLLHEDSIGAINQLS